MTCPDGREGLVPLHRIGVFSKRQRSKEVSVVLLTKCPKLFAGIEEHCRLVEEGTSY